MKQKRGCLKLGLVLISLLFFICGFAIWGFTTAYYGISISPDGKMLVVTTPSQVTIYRLSDGKVLHREKGKPYGIQDYQGEFSYIAWSPDGTNLAIGKLYNGIWIWDTETWKLLTEKDGDIGARNEPSFAWSPDGQQLVLGTGNGEIWVWNERENQWKLKSKARRGLVSVTWTNDGQLIELIGHEIHDVEEAGFLTRLDHYIDGYGNASWSPDGSHVYIFFDLGGGVMNVKANEYEFGAGVFPEFAWSKDGQYFASVRECSNEIFVWDTVNDKIVRQEQQGNVIYSLEWTPDGNLLALGIRGWQTVVWNTNTGEVLMNMFVPPNLACLFD